MSRGLGDVYKRQHVAVSGSKDDANDGEGVESLGTVAKVEFNKHLKMEIFDEDNKVVDLKDAGVYTARIDSKSEAGNYDVDVKVTNLVVASSKVFSDVHTSDWFYKPVFEAKKLSYMGGYNGTSLFGPNKSITRGEVACVLYNIADNADNVNENDLEYSDGNGWYTGFSDVDGKAYYGKAIAWAKHVGVVNGYGDGTFAPDSPVTREELACMLANFAETVEVEDTTVEDADKVLGTVSDGSAVSDWAKGSVAWAVENEIMGNAGFVNAFSDITRAETAAMVVNYKACLLYTSPSPRDTR